MPDAAAFGAPPGADTLGNIARLRGLKLPNLERLGIGCIKPLAGIAAVPPTHRLLHGVASSWGRQRTALLP
jgi:phosphopentomutase